MKIADRVSVSVKSAGKYRNRIKINAGKGDVFL